MGAGGRMQVSPPSSSPGTNTLKRVPCETPPFTLGDLKKAIPPHCFKRSIPRSFSSSTSSSPPRLLPLPPLHSLLPSPLPRLTPLLGLPRLRPNGPLGHSPRVRPPRLQRPPVAGRRRRPRLPLLPPRPVLLLEKSDIKWYGKYLNNPLGRTVMLTVQFKLGWPLYLAFNVSGRPYSDGFACHFHPNAPIYNDRERLQIYISDAGVLSVCYGLYRYAASRGVASVVCVYGVPLLIVNCFLVLITYLQHTHPSLPHYDSSEWDWLRGALATVDRDYGILNKFDGTPAVKAMWREAKECIYVEPDRQGEKKGVFWYNNKL